jgi:hypothetical protein
MVIMLEFTSYNVDFKQACHFSLFIRFSINVASNQWKKIAIKMMIGIGTPRNHKSTERITIS